MYKADTKKIAENTRFYEYYVSIWEFKLRDNPI